jgi:putative peptidoglycan lipid II flippase
MVERRGIARAAMLLSGLAVVSALLGLARDVVIAARFGASSELDAYLVAQGLMNLALGLLAGAMAKAAVPVLARGVAHGEVLAAHRTALVALSVTTVVLSLASIAMWVAAGPVVELLAPGFGAAEQRLAQRLTRIVLVATVFIAGTNLLASVAQAHRRFFWAGVQGVPFNVVMIVAAAVFGPRYGIAALAVGFVVGSAARFGAQLVPLRSIGLRLAPSFDVSDPGFRAIATLVPPLLVGSAIGNVNTLVDRAVGSTTGDGAISALSYGWRVAALAEMLLIAPLLTVLYPAFGAAEHRRDLARLVQRGLSTMAVVLAPVAIVLVMASTSVVAVVFGRGSFGADDVERTATALAWYAPAMVALGWREVVVRAQYSTGDARTPVTVAVGAMVVNVVGDVTLGRRYGVPGLALSTTLSIGLAAVAGTLLLARRHRAVDVGAVATSIARITGAAAVAVAVAGVVLGRLDPQSHRAGVAPLLQVTVVAGCVLASYGAVLAVLRAPELKIVGGAVGDLRRRGRRDR